MFWALIATCRLSLVVVSWGYSLVVVHGLLAAEASLVVGHGQYRAWTRVILAHGLSCPVARGIFPD